MPVVHVADGASVVPCVAPDAPRDAVPPGPPGPVPLRPAAERHELELEAVALRSVLSDVRYG